MTGYFFAGSKSGRLEHPGFDDELAARDIEALPGRRRRFGEYGALVRSDDAACARLAVEDDDLAGGFEA